MIFFSEELVNAIARLRRAVDSRSEFRIIRVRSSNLNEDRDGYASAYYVNVYMVKAGDCRRVRDLFSLKGGKRPKFVSLGQQLLLLCHNWLGPSSVQHSHTAAFYGKPTRS